MSMTTSSQTGTLPSSSLRSDAQRLRAAVGRTLAREEDAISFGHGVYQLEGDAVLCLPRATGDSRRPYGGDGLNFWAYGSGYMHANDGLFSILPKRTEGQEPAVAFMAAVARGRDWQPFPIATVPARSNNDRATRFTVLGNACACYFCEMDGLLLTLRVFPEDPRSMWFSLHVENRASEGREVLLSAYFNPLLRHQLHDTDEDRWFREIRVVQETEAEDRLFLMKVNEDKDRYTSIAHHHALRRMVRMDPAGVRLLDEQCTTSRYDYMGGPALNLSNSLPLRSGRFERCPRVTAFTEPAIAGDLLRVALPPGGEARLDYHFAALEREESESSGSIPLPDPTALDQRVKEAEERAASRREALSLRAAESSNPTINADTFTAFFGHVQTQVEFCALMKGYVQLSENSLIGIRDVFQAIEGLLYWRPEAARAKMLEALSYTCSDGRCLRQYSLPGRNGSTGRMDLRPFIDQGCWIISTVATYVRVTGDTAFLGEECGYCEIVDEATGRVRPSADHGSVLEHLCIIMDYLLANRAPDTGTIRALYGDWNDALDGLGTLPDGRPDYGNGVSVMGTLQVHQNLAELVELLTVCSTPPAIERSRSYAKARMQLADSLERHAVQRDRSGERRIVHGWGHDKAYFVGSTNDVDGVSRDSVTANAFWVLGGMLGRDPSLRKDILAAFGRLDSKYGLKTFEPAFGEEVRGVGRIGKLPPGTAENGATYIHATAFAIMALFEMGESDLAWQQLGKILPFTPLHDRLSHSPFVMPNSYGYFPGKGIDGQNMNDWQTGSSNVVLKTIIRHVIGFHPTKEALRIQPADHIPFGRLDATLKARGIAFRIERRHARRPKRTFTVNGNPATPFRDQAMGIDVIELPFDALPPGCQTIHIAVED